MSAVFAHSVTVGAGAIDGHGHANNVEYLNWMQSAAIAHSTSQGFGARRYSELGGGWFVRSHQIRYLKPAMEADVVIVHTWVASLRRAHSLRRYRFERGDDLLATAETDWVWVDLATGKPAPVPDQVASAFEVVADGDAC